MENKDLHYSITVNVTPAAAFDGISRVAEWWTKSYQGASREPGDIFSIRFGETTADFKVIEAIPEKKAVWLVIDCYLHFLANKTEWKGTQIIWEITPKGNATQIDMTHLGLVPEVECYNECSKGWGFYVKESLFKLLNEGKGMPDRERSCTSTTVA